MIRWSIVSILLAGCAASPLVALPPDHPASPRAAEAPSPPRSTALAAPPVTTAPSPAAEAGHGGHGAHGGHR